ncbi:hypothetical protein [Nocardia sp. CA-290969]|uniref:hypothetical protein n=1 Tax=Nocardia sp. CA-290969 TaxID=3239986 RepID=UPI003D8C9333
MSMPAFRLDPSAVISSSAAAYELSPTPGYPITGRVVAVVEEYQVRVDDRVEPRPRVRFEFSDLTVGAVFLGDPCCMVEFHPDFSDATDGYRMVSLGEPGYLQLVTASEITVASEQIRRCVADLLAALTIEFLTDPRVARARRDEAFAQLQHARTQYLDLITINQGARERVQRARATLAAATALLRSVQAPLAGSDKG